MKLLLSGVLLICSTTLKAERAEVSFPTDFKASFELYKRGVLVAETEYQLQRKQQIVFQSNTSLKGFVALFKEDNITEQSLYSLATPVSAQLNSYQFKQSGDKNKSISSIVNWQQQNITTTIDKQAVITSALKQPIWDKHSIFLALMSRLDAETKRLTFNILDKGKISKYDFNFTGTKEIEMDEDEWIKTSVWQRESKNRKTIFYLDPANRYIPVKIEQYKNQQTQATLWLKELNWYE